MVSVMACKLQAIVAELELRIKSATSTSGAHYSGLLSPSKHLWIGSLGGGGGRTDSGAAVLGRALLDPVLDLDGCLSDK